MASYTSPDGLEHTLADAKNVALGWAYLAGKTYGVWAASYSLRSGGL